MTTRPTMTIAVFAVLLASASAKADVPPMDIAGCSGKALGSECLTDDGRSGACSEVEWSRPRYGPNGPNGSWTGKVIRCVAPQPPTRSGIAQESPNSGPHLWGDLPAGAVAGLGATGLVAVAATAILVRRRRRSRPTA